MKDVICKVEEGKLRGQEVENTDGTTFLKFLGIPYGKPPLGQLRFKAPQPPEKWERIKDATEQTSCCFSNQIIISPEGVTQNVMGSEDCLYLNVFTKKLLNTDDDNLKPVMFFIHGGGFVTASCDAATQGPHYLMTEDIVFVTLNYRLGVLGFLSFDDPLLEVTGNAGLKDMVQALKWVQKNIKQFSGDPNNVTIFGKSAGGAAVHYLVLSPLAEGLFHKAIMQSGTALCPWAHGINDARKLAKMIGCVETDEKKLLKFLQEVPVEELVKTQIKLADSLDPSEKRQFSPSIEPKTKYAFLYEDSVKIIDSSQYNHVPIMLGYNSLEGLIIEWGRWLGENEYYKEIIPYYFGISKNDPNYEVLNKKIADFYFKTDSVDPNNKEALYNLFTDTMFFLGIYNTVKAHVKTCQEPIFFYRMTLETELNFFKKMIKTEIKGASHIDDLRYLFKNRDVDVKPGSLEEKSVKRFVKMWTNFAKYGNPILAKDALLDAEWKPVTDDVFNFMNIDSDLVAGVDPDIDRMNFWNEISEDIEYSY